MKTKNIMIVAAAGALACSAALVACSQSSSSPTSSTSSSASNVSSAVASNVVDEVMNVVKDKADEVVNETVDTTAGGWSAYTEEEGANLLSDDQKNLFVKAVDATGKTSLKPYAVVARQLVAGTNYAYLCQGDSKWAIVVVYEDLSDNASVTSVRGIDINKIATVKEADEDAVGSWKAVKPNTAAILASDISEAWKAALADTPELEVEPIAVLAQQVVAGMNYKVLCVGKTASGQKADELYVATLYVPVDGTTAQISDMALFDMTKYSEVMLDTELDVALQTMGEVGEPAASVAAGATRLAQETVEQTQRALGTVKATDNQE